MDSLQNEKFILALHEASYSLAPQGINNPFSHVVSLEAPYLLTRASGMRGRGGLPHQILMDLKAKSQNLSHQMTFYYNILICAPPDFQSFRRHCLLTCQLVSHPSLFSFHISSCATNGVKTLAIFTVVRVLLNFKQH